MEERSSLVAVGLWAAWVFAISHFCSGIHFRVVFFGVCFFFGDCLNSMLFGLLRRVLCNMCLVGAECAGVLMLNC